MHLTVVSMILLLFWSLAGATDYRVGDRLAPGVAAVAAGYREIRWDELVPAGWDPAAEFRSLDLARLRDSDPRARQALARLRAAWDAAPVEPALDGQAVRLAGFVIPLERRGKLVSELLLVPYFGACIHTPPPPANQTIHVVLVKPMADLQTMDAFWISGTLKVGRGESGLGAFGYRLRGEQLERYSFRRD